MKPLFIFVAALIMLTGCQAGNYVLKAVAPLEEEGEVYLYTSPFPQEASRLKFKLSGVSAVREDNAEFPLALSIPEVDGAGMTNQRRFASGRLPPGVYTGFSVKAEKATLETEEGEADLLVPKDPVTINSAFVVGSRKAAFLSLAFNYSESVRKSFGFTPVFSVVTPEKTITKLVGYVSNSGSHDLSVFDKKAKKVSAYIPTGRGPTGMAFDQTRNRAYVSLSGEDEVAVMDVAAGVRLSGIRLDVGDNPGELALTPDGRVLITVNGGSNSISFIDPASLTVLSKVSVGEGPVSVLMDRKGRMAYVINYRSNSISVIDVANRVVAGTISTEAGPLRGQLNRAGDRLYVIHAGSPDMMVFSVPLYTVLNRIYMGIGMLSIKVDPSTDLIYVSRNDETRLSVYDPFSFIPVDYIEAPGSASYMAIDDEENILFLVIPEGGKVATVSLGSRKTLSVFDAGDGPAYISLMGERY